MSNLVINFKFMNQEKFSNILTILENLDLQFSSKQNIQITFNSSNPLIIQTPFLSIDSINNNELILNLSDDNNEIQYFINFIQKLEIKINNLYNLKKKFHSSSSLCCQEYLFNSNFIFDNFDQHFLKLFLNSNNVEIDNSNQPFKINKINDLEKTYCYLFLEIKDIWEQNKQFGYHLSVFKFDRSQSHLLPNYSFINSDSENDSQDDILLFGDPIINDNSSSEDNK